MEALTLNKSRLEDIWQQPLPEAVPRCSAVSLIFAAVVVVGTYATTGFLMYGGVITASSTLKAVLLSGKIAGVLCFFSHPQEIQEYVNRCVVLVMLATIRVYEGVFGIFTSPEKTVALPFPMALFPVVHAYASTKELVQLLISYSLEDAVACLRENPQLVQKLMTHFKMDFFALPEKLQQIMRQVGPEIKQLSFEPTRHLNFNVTGWRDPLEMVDKEAFIRFERCFRKIVEVFPNLEQLSFARGWKCHHNILQMLSELKQLTRLKIDNFATIKRSDYYPSSILNIFEMIDNGVLFGCASKMTISELFDALSGCTQLESVELDFKDIFIDPIEESVCLKVVHALSHLHTLKIENVNVWPRLKEYLLDIFCHCKALRHLSIITGYITPKVLEVLKQFPELQSLAISNLYEIDAVKVKELLSKLTKLTSFELHDTQLDEHTFTLFPTSLQKLKLVNCSGITENCIKVLNERTQIQELVLIGCTGMNRKMCALAKLVDGRKVEIHRFAPTAIEKRLAPFCKALLVEIQELKKILRARGKEVSQDPCDIRSLQMIPLLLYNDPIFREHVCAITKRPAYTPVMVNNTTIYEKHVVDAQASPPQYRLVNEEAIQTRLEIYETVLRAHLQPSLESEEDRYPSGAAYIADASLWDLTGEQILERFEGRNDFEKGKMFAQAHGRFLLRFANALEIPQNDETAYGDVVDAVFPALATR